MRRTGNISNERCHAVSPGPTFTQAVWGTLGIASSGRLATLEKIAHLTLMASKYHPLMMKHATGSIKALPLPAFPARGRAHCLARCASGVTRHQMALFHAQRFPVR
ncbi:MAG: hypothetical protein RugAbin2_00123 [Rugosibacter sp.]|nr:hypothetical protein [Rugosibacter sp.]